LDGPVQFPLEVSVRYRFEVNAIGTSYDRAATSNSTHRERVGACTIEQDLRLESISRVERQSDHRIEPMVAAIELDGFCQNTAELFGCPGRHLMPARLANEDGHLVGLELCR